MTTGRPGSTHGFELAEPGLATFDRDALDAIFTATYDELRRLASSVRSGDASATINPTTLVHEAWFKLVASPDFTPVSRLHFKRIAARAMRQVLVEAARRRQTHKRGRGIAFVTFDDSLDEPATGADEVLRLDIALHELARLSPRQAVMIEARFFGGLDVSETAQLLGISEATVLRDWRSAKAWLASEIAR